MSCTVAPDTQSGISIYIYIDHYNLSGKRYEVTPAHRVQQIYTDGGAIMATGHSTSRNFRLTAY